MYSKDKKGGLVTVLYLCFSVFVFFFPLLPLPSLNIWVCVCLYVCMCVYLYRCVCVCVMFLWVVPSGFCFPRPSEKFPNFPPTHKLVFFPFLLFLSLFPQYTRSLPPPPLSQKSFSSLPLIACVFFFSFPNPEENLGFYLFFPTEKLTLSLYISVSLTLFLFSVGTVLFLFFLVLV